MNAINKVVAIKCEGSMTLDLNELKEFQGDLKALTKENYDKLKSTILNEGFCDPMNVYSHEGKWYLLDGHQRRLVLTGLREEGYLIPPLPCNKIHAKSKEEAKKLILTFSSNYGRISEESLSDFMIDSNLGVDFLDLSVSLAEIENTFSESEQSKEGLTDDDEVPEVSGLETICKLGDVWQLGDHRIMCGDSTSIDAVEKLMNGKKADMVFTDPPYGVSYTGGHNEKKRKGIENDTLEGASLTDLFAGAINTAYAVSNDHAAFYIWYANGKAVETFASFSKIPLKVRAVICWYKVKSGLGAFMSQYIPNYEPCIYAHKEGCSPQWFGPTDEKTVWELKKESKNEFHPTQKPIELPERALKNSSKPSDNILDLFGGSGSTLIACEKTNRKCFMMELDPHYCDVIIKRWEDFTGNKAELIENIPDPK